ncbi:MAG: hypothetical protein E4G91_02010 [Candidatus Zixiibacteriota bacterium]|nr:MAG: hypothetical protein E4G91_02010 [candidate division Zixibacteria bacterium]
MKAFPKIILVFLAVNWPIFSRRPMVKALAKVAKEHGSTVVAVNRPLCPLSTLVRKPERFGEMFSAARIEDIGENLRLFSPKYFVHDQIAQHAGTLERLNVAALRHNYQYLAARLGISEKAPLVWYYDPQQGYVTRLFPDSFCVYEIYDRLSNIWGRPRPLADALEVKWRSKVDLLLTTSRKLFDRYSPHYRNALPFGNGLDRDAFNKFCDEAIKPHPDIVKIPGPRIGYAGNISERLDWELIKGMARLRPEWSFVFVGRVGGIDSGRITQDNPNIRFLGEYKYEEVPAIIKGFDVGIMPYLNNPFFDYLNPLKFYENAAAGIGSVSSPIEELNHFPVAIVRTVPNEPRRWVDTLADILSSERSQTREVGREIASQFIWEDMTAALMEKMQQLLP